MGMEDHDRHSSSQVGNVKYLHGESGAATDEFGRPIVTLDPRAEAKLRLKIDFFVVPPVALLYLFCFIDRANIGNARLAGLEAELGLVGNDYNAVLSIFYVAYVVFEIPATLTCKWMGPGWFLPLSTLGFGFMSIMTGLVHSKAAILGVRFLLGIFEAGMMPGIAYYLSRWYRRSELTFRLGLYIVTAPLSGAFGGLLASGILTLNSIGGLKSWRMIFVIEGIITCGLSLIALAVLTDRPDTARWLTEEEKDLASTRVKSERIATTVLLDKMDVSKLKRGVANPITLTTAFIFLLNNITAIGISFFLPTIIRTIYPDKTTIQQQLLTVPPYAVGAFFVLLVPTLSWYLDTRQIFLILSYPAVLVGYIMFLVTTNPQTRYGAIFLMASTIYTLGAMCNANVSANVVSDTARAIAIGTNVAFGNVGGLISTWTYFTWDSPVYAIGNGINVAACSLAIIVGLYGLFYMKWDNKRRDRRSQVEVMEELAGMTMGQVQDLDWRHPAFRWKP